MFRADDRNAPHWSADFVEHIRTVHFALVGVCLGLVGLIQFQRPNDVAAAQYQLQEIKSAVDHWDSGEVTGVIKQGQPTDLSSRRCLSSARSIGRKSISLS